MSIIVPFILAGGGAPPPPPPHVTPAPPSDFKVLSVVAVRENVVCVEFSAAVYWSGVLDTRDASNPARYSIVEVSGTKGLNDEEARPVRVVSAEVAALSNPAMGEAGRFLDITIDRPFTPYPAEYRLTLNGLYSPDVQTADIPPDWTLLDGPTSTDVAFFGAFRIIEQPELYQPVRSRDIANPVSRKGANTNDEQFRLGVYVYDETGDYGTDEGEPSLVKRIFRRLFSRPGAFLHLGNDYGVGLASYGKKLLQAGLQQTIRAKAEQQLLREPEIAQARVTWQQDPTNPSLVRVRVLVRTRAGVVQKYESPIRLAA